MQGWPWLFDKVLVCLKECHGLSAPKDMQFDLEPFWIQLHDMRFVGMNTSTGKNLVNL